MSKMTELLKQKEELEKAIAEEAKAGRADAVKTVREMIKQYKMTATDLKGLLKTRAKRGTGAKATAKKATTKA